MTDRPGAGGWPGLPSLVGSVLLPQVQSWDRSSRPSLSPHHLPIGGPANRQPRVPDRISRRPEGWVAISLRAEAETPRHPQSPVSQREGRDALGPVGLPSLDLGLRLEPKTHGASVLRDQGTLTVVCL